MTLDFFFGSGLFGWNNNWHHNDKGFSFSLSLSSGLVVVILTELLPIDNEEVLKGS